MTDQNAAEGQIRGLLDEWARALRAKDAARVMAHYAADSLTFDLAPPLISTATNAQGLEAWFSTWQSPLGYEIRDLRSRRAMTWPSATASAG